MPKSKKDPNKPKGVKSAYIFFTEHRREQDNGEVKADFGTFSRECSEAWRNMTEEDKLPFVLLSNKDRARHQRQMEGYEPPSDSDSDENGPKKKKRKKKDPNAPKKNISAYFFFAASIRSQVKAALTGNGGEAPRVTEVMKVIGERWGQCVAEDRKQFDQKADTDRERYQKQLEQYNKFGAYE